MLKLEFKEASGVLLVLATLSIGVAVIGTNPLNSSNVLDLWMRATLGALGIILLAIALILLRATPRSNGTTPVNPEYEQRFRDAQAKIADITPEEKLLGEASIGRVKFDVINDNILGSRADVIVSSDDNQLRAMGGVAKAVLVKAGSDVAKELARYSRTPLRQGQLVITTGGDWGCRAIIHPAVIDLDENRYPTAELIKLIVRRSLDCALAIGARSISFPVLGGGTASKHLKPSESVCAIVDEIVTFLNEHKNDGEFFTHIALYIYNKNDASGLPPLLTGAIEPATAE